MPNGLGTTAASWLINSCSVGALAFLTYDICITLDDEVDCIWTPSRAWRIEWLFLFLRYVPLVTLLSDRFIGASLSSGPAFLGQVCKEWFIWQDVAAHAVMIVLEILLVIRVHALYDRSRRVTAVLISLLLVTSLAYTADLILLFKHTRFGSTCVLSWTPRAVIYFGAAALFSHFVVLSMTFAKYLKHRRTGLGNIPILSLVIRDGSIAFASTFTILIASTTVYMAFDGMLSPMGYSWFLAVASAAGCRLILNMRRFSSLGTPFTVFTSVSPYSEEPGSVGLSIFTMA